MEHSTAIMEDAGNAIESAKRSPSNAPDPVIKSENNEQPQNGRQNNYDRRKRKNDFGGGGRGGQNNNAGDNKRHKKGDMGRGEYFRDQPDKRQRTSDSRAKRESGRGPSYGSHFTTDEIAAEERRPKRKVAVMIGYSGTGYKGMQISPSEKTIEGDLFAAFIAAGAISKANADDPKKASLVRCARTDKGVHAAGNMISLKLIVEEEDIVEKINAALSPQIRVWGIVRTIGSFSCYQACDSRWYEYLIPSYAFLPPHPSSWLAKQLEAHADEAGDRSGYEVRQAEVMGFWERVDREEIEPVLLSIDEDIRYDVIRALQGEDEASAKAARADADVAEVGKGLVKAGRSLSTTGGDDEEGGGEDGGKGRVSLEKTEEAAIIINEPAIAKEDTDGAHSASESTDAENTLITSELDKSNDTRPPSKLSEEALDRQIRLRAATKRLRAAYTTAKRHYRIPTSRIDRIQAALDKFVGTANYHNYTIQKTYRDPSAKRHIKSFVVNPKPILIGDGPKEERSEWLSLKVHGQSFMMHQIRKMVGMVTLLVRCGSDLSTLDESLTEARFSIPKVPGLGLLLERPVFDSYNNLQAPKHGREKLEFGRYEEEMEAFKEKEIYQRIFAEEEAYDEFGRFFNHVDNFKEPYFLFVTSKGHAATAGIGRKAKLGPEVDEMDEVSANGAEVKREAEG